CPVVPTPAGSKSGPPNGSSGPTLMRYKVVPGVTLVKSTMTSNRSATPTRNCCSATGRGRNPPSAPMTHIGRTVAPPGAVDTLRISVRALLALRTRNRYRRASTLSTGQVLPLTTMVLPKNSGFQNGGTSGGGINGPFGGVSPKKPRLSGKKSVPSALNDLSWMISGNSKYLRPGGSPGIGAGPGSTPAGRSAEPPRNRYMPSRPE